MIVYALFYKILSHQNYQRITTVCQRSLDPFYIVLSYYLNFVKTSWTHGNTMCPRGSYSFYSVNYCIKCLYIYIFIYTTSFDVKSHDLIEKKTPDD